MRNLRRWLDGCMRALSGWGRPANAVAGWKVGVSGWVRKLGGFCRGCRSCEPVHVADERRHPVRPVHGADGSGGFGYVDADGRHPERLLAAAAKDGNGHRVGAEEARLADADNPDATADRL